MIKQNGKSYPNSTMGGLRGTSQIIIPKGHRDP